ncbi:SpoIIE family protein phosphatase [Streptomyces sp. AV19]|uniref:SpoIIE family protein phosphatase n=1 Tax=Streptomyces sp. AV19 TaxID=2793068 RepID=UPI0018FEE77C|nr:SpoIIE family protein phosphatase [Streptomyces sp. AV19]MBH1937882.1 SpoIIE family protein phosphatase [Streptomyces sp. AV19]MDG4536519.1 SpoIIE family protein phosphatase [Streptomyces sp. AV19]
MDTHAGQDPQGKRYDGAAFGEWAFLQFPIGIAVYDRDNRLVRVNDEMVRLVGMPEEEMRGRRMTEFLSGQPFEDFADIAARVLRTGVPVRTDNYFPAPADGSERATACFFTPLTDGDGAVQGVSIAALDITEEYRARQRLALVSDASARIGTTLDATRTATELAEATVGRFADAVGVDLLEPGAPEGAPTLRRTAWRTVADGGPPAGAEPYAVPPGSPPALALASGKPSLHRVDEPGVRAWAEACGVLDGTGTGGARSLLLLPLDARDSVVGLALFVRSGETEPFDVHDLPLAEEIGARTAVCIDNARRYARERSVALTLQRSLLPARLPSHSAVDATSRYLPATSQAGIGGDWYDVIPLSGARVALVVGDIVGHGLQASATMGRLRAAVRTLADIDLPPDELLTHLDDLVVQLSQDRAAEEGDEPREMGASCLYAVYDPVTRRCVMARAGHPPPVLVTPDGTARFVGLPEGPHLGVGGLPFESLELELPEGSLLALYTDGLVGGDGPEPGTGSETLREMLGRSAGARSLERTCDEVLARLLPERPADDIALLLARTRALGGGQVGSWELTPHPASVAEARKRVLAQLEEWGLEELAFTTELVVSELVTNAIRHAEPPILLRLIRDGALICEVSDASSTTPRMRRARVFDEGGRGLLLVAQLCRRWGTRFTAGGKTIWAEQPLTEAA